MGTDDVAVRQVAWDDPRVTALHRLMGAEMGERYAGRRAGEPASVVAAREQALVVDPADVRATLLALAADGEPLGTAALRDLRGDREVKRVVVVPTARSRGVGRALMGGVERVAREAGARRLVLQTGDLQPEAIGLYESLGWTPVPVYEPYASTMPWSHCYERLLAPG